MLSLYLGLCLAVATSADGANAGAADANGAQTDQDYTLAYKRSVEEDKPLMVVVGAEWCPACNVLKKTTIANMEMTGELDDVSLAVVDRDAEPELAKRLMADEKMIPQIIVFSKTDDGRWSRERLTGYQPAQPIRSLLRRVIRFGRG